MIIIDNQAMDISYSTIKTIRKITEYCDFIITFQDANITRAIYSQSPKIENFFGNPVPYNIKNVRNKICDIYCNQLSKINLSKIEKMRVKAQNGFFYTLLFCCRRHASGELLKIIQYYNNQRFRSRSLHFCFE